METYIEETNKIMLMVYNDYLMSIKGNKLIFEKVKEEGNAIFLKVHLVDVVLVDDFYKCVDFLTKSCLQDKTVFISKLNYPNHVKKLIENGYILEQENLVKEIEIIKEKERG